MLRWLLQLSDFQNLQCRSELHHERQHDFVPDQSPLHA